ncbi:hypothetical protein H696_03592 [Fonticula alba]|uniref:Cytochrome c oxidase assembly protein COX19 n=1 Tax=Fonticula alba TaxID=691883 RepID=A0A058Z7P4_FONAL|nr:hypothetical protein H696_03592 [Fonticula alba]KCV70131.1 hypothetical protein H696_03592 [Fonticula alba]|eukprot:XP_009495737.1 hypothetical protein H696_03592 [Fonticula alba]
MNMQTVGSSTQRSPPERGSFPLDRTDACRLAMSLYMDCLREAANDTSKCRDLAQSYLECRMNTGLMEKDNMSNLGFKDNAAASAPTDEAACTSSSSTPTEAAAPGS